MRRSLEDAGALVDGLGPQADTFVVQLLGCAVHGLGDQAALWYLALRSADQHKQNWVNKRRNVCWFPFRTKTSSGMRG